MTWFSLIPATLFAVACVFVPGYAVGWALKVPQRFRVGFAPLLSIAVISLAAIVTGKVGIHWGVIPLLVFMVVLVGILWGAYYLLGKRLEVPQPFSLKGVSLGWPLAGAIVGGALLSHTTRDMVYGPEAFSQSLDNSFHLNAIQWIEDHGDASSLTLGALADTHHSPVFYPAGWHDLVYLVYSSCGVSIPTATIVTILVTVGFIWSFSFIALALSIPKVSRLQALAIPAVTCGFFAYPGLLLRWGVLYPNLIGYAVMPAAIALIILTVRAVVKGRNQRLWTLIPTLLLGLIGCALAHPNALVSVAVFVVPFLLAMIGKVVRIYRKSRQTAIAGGIILVALATCVAVWYMIRPGEFASNTWTSVMSEGEAVYQFLFFGLENANQLGDKFEPSYIMAFLTLWGAGYLIYKRRNLWIITSWILVGYLWVISASVERGPFRMLMVSPWYTDHFRLATLVVLPGVILSGIGLGAIVQSVLKFVLARLPRVNDTRYPQVLLVASAVIVLVAAGFTSRTQAVHDATLAVSKEYRIEPSSVVVSSDEMNVIEHIPDYVPQGDIIANNPWDGSPYIYSLVHRNLTGYHFDFKTDEKYRPIYKHLKDAKTDPEVCKVVNENNVHWYVHFKNPLNFGPDAQNLYDGMSDAVENGVLTPVYTSGEMGLYRISACDS